MNLFLHPFPCADKRFVSVSETTLMALVHEDVYVLDSEKEPELQASSGALLSGD